MEVGVSAFMTVAMLKWFFPQVGRSGVSRFGLLVCSRRPTSASRRWPGRIALSSAWKIEVAGFGSNFRIQAIHVVNAFRPMGYAQTAEMRSGVFLG